MRNREFFKTGGLQECRFEGSIPDCPIAYETDINVITDVRVSIGEHRRDCALLRCEPLDDFEAGDMIEENDNAFLAMAKSWRLPRLRT